MSDLLLQRPWPALRAPAMDQPQARGSFRLPQMGQLRLTRHAAQMHAIRIRHPLPYYDRSTFLDFAPRPSPSLQFPARKTKPCKADALFLVTDGHWSHHQQPMLRVEVARLERYYTSSFAGFRWKGFAVTLTCKESVGIVQLPFPIAKGLRCS